MKIVFITFIAAMLSGPAFATTCPDLTAEYHNTKIVQTGCEKAMVYQLRPGGLVVDELFLDNVYRTLPSMPQFPSAATFNSYQLIINAKDAAGKHVRIFLMSKTAEGDLLSQRIILDGEGNIVSSDGFIDPHY